jgi:hypothetical protein
MPPKVARCPYCSKALPTQNAVRLHVAATPECKETWNQQFSQNIKKPSQRLPLKTPEQNHPSSPWIIPNSPTDDEMETFADNFNLPELFVTPSESIVEDITRPPSSAKNVEVEDQALRFSQQYPRPIANPISFQNTRFEKKQGEDIMNGKLPWEPFSSQDEWELASWLISNVNQKATDKYLKLPIVSYWMF